LIQREIPSRSSSLVILGARAARLAHVTRDALIARLRREIGAPPGLRLVVLFGSEARGEARADSDIDLAVAGRDLDLFGLAGALSAALDREVDVVLLADAPVPLLESLVAEACPVYEAQPGEFAVWRSRALATLETDRPWYARMRDAHLARLRGERSDDAAR
jgi:predicted nucleotidyltransferase